MILSLLRILFTNPPKVVMTAPSELYRLIIRDTTKPDNTLFLTFYSLRDIQDYTRKLTEALPDTVTVTAYHYR